MLNEAAGRALLEGCFPVGELYKQIHTHSYMCIVDMSLQSRKSRTTAISYCHQQVHDVLSSPGFPLVLIIHNWDFPRDIITCANYKVSCNIEIFRGHVQRCNPG